jgi:hypothetical protein
MDLNSLVLFYEVVNAQSISIPKSTFSRKLSFLEDQAALELAAANAHDRHPDFIMKLRITFHLQRAA